MRSSPLASTIALSLGAAFGSDRASTAAATTPTACELGQGLDRSAQSFLRSVLADTGLIGTSYASTRSEIGIVGISYSQVVIVQDTVKCRRAINAWQTFYATLSAELGAKAAAINSGMLFRITPNRFILAMPMLNQYSFLTYIALDSAFVVVRKNL